jgi:hypothetical protein
VYASGLRAERRAKDTHIYSSVRPHTLIVHYYGLRELRCDERFAGWTKGKPLLSKWMKDRVEIIDQFGAIAGKLSMFFQKHKLAEAPAALAASASVVVLYICSSLRPLIY